MWVCLKDGPKFSHLAQSETNHFLLAKILLSVIPWSLTKIKFQHWHWQANIIRVAPQRTLLRGLFARLGPPLRGPAKNTRSSVRRSGGLGGNQRICMGNLHAGSWKMTKNPRMRANCTKDHRMRANCIKDPRSRANCKKDHRMRANCTKDHWMRANCKKINGS